MAIPKLTRRVGVAAFFATLCILAGVTALFAQEPARISAAGESPAWVNALDYGSVGGGFYWDFTSGQVWTAERGWHLFSPAKPTPAGTTLWVNYLTYGSVGGGFYLDPFSGQVWTAERGWHLFNPQSTSPATATPTSTPTRTPLPSPSPSPSPSPVPAAGQRATADRADTISGPQIHIVYAIPSDGVDEHLDTNGKIKTSVTSFQNWLIAETGGKKLKIDSYGGDFDITFFRLSKSEADVAKRVAFVRDEIEQEGIAAGVFQPSGKIYAVYYGGLSTYACGGGAWPPSLPGTVAAMYLKGQVPGQIPCANNPLGASVDTPGYLDIAMLHEILHTMGFVPTCAPHQTLSGHVSDSNNDLLYAGPLPWYSPWHLDIGRDDYYGHGRTDCPDLANSPYLTN